MPPRHKALLEGTIDAGLQSVPWSTVAEEAGMNNLGDATDYVPDWQFVSVNTNDAWASANRDIVVRFLRALQRATDWLYGHRQEASAIAARELPAPLAQAEQAWDFFTGSGALARDMALNRKGLAAVMATLRATGLLPAGAPADPDFCINDGYLREARGGVARSRGGPAAAHRASGRARRRPSASTRATIAPPAGGYALTSWRWNTT